MIMNTQTFFKIHKKNYEAKKILFIYLFICLRILVRSSFTNSTIQSTRHAEKRNTNILKQRMANRRRNLVLMTNLTIHRTRIEATTIKTAIQLLSILKKHSRFMSLTTGTEHRLCNTTTTASKQRFDPLGLLLFQILNLLTIFFPHSDFRKNSPTSTTRAEDRSHHVAAAVALDVVDGTEPRISHAVVPAEAIIQDVGSVKIRLR